MNIPMVNETSMLLQSANVAREAIVAENFESSLQRAVENSKSPEIKKASIEMEALFLNMMLQAMRRTIPEPQGMFERSHGEKIMQEMLDQEMSINMANAGGIGIAQALYRQLMQEN